jgi:hypothetical protein
MRSLHVSFITLDAQRTSSSGEPVFSTPTHIAHITATLIRSHLAEWEWNITASLFCPYASLLGVPVQFTLDGVVTATIVTGGPAVNANGGFAATVAFLVHSFSDGNQLPLSSHHSS